jgi:hypothetical protein
MAQKFSNLLCNNQNQTTNASELQLQTRVPSIPRVTQVSYVALIVIMLLSVVVWCGGFLAAKQALHVVISQIRESVSDRPLA